LAAKNLYLDTILLVNKSISNNNGQTNMYPINAL
jgi:hypothetical protein